MKLRFSLLLLLIAAALSAAGTGSQSKETTLRVGIHAFPGSLNPVYVTDETAQGVVNKIFDSLFFFDGEGHIRRGLVREYRLKDNITITLLLKEGVYFSNGTELSAADVTATLRLLKNPDFKYPYGSSLAFIQRFEPAGRYRVTITLKEPFALWRNMLVFKVLCGSEIDRAKPRTFREAVLSGTGPYRIERVSMPHRIVLCRNPYSPAGSLFPRIDYRVIAYPHLMPLKLISGETDLGELQPEHVRAYAGNGAWQSRFNILKYRKFGYTYLIFNLRNPEISAGIRKIFYNLLICGDFIGRFLGKRGEAVNTPFLLLKEKIVPVPFEEPLPARTIDLRILTNSESKIRKELVLFLKQALRPHRINLQPVFREYNMFLDSLKKGRFDLAVSGFVLDIDYDMKDVLDSHAFFNYAHLENREMDRLLEAGLREMAAGRREEIYLKAHQVWLGELPLLPLFNLYYYVGVSKRIRLPRTTCRLMSSTGDFLQNIREWKIGFKGK